MPLDPNLMPDFSKENQYEFECGGCHGHFLGHKGRVLCDVCKLAAEDGPEDEDECVHEDYEINIIEVGGPACQSIYRKVNVLKSCAAYLPPV